MKVKKNPALIDDIVRNHSNTGTSCCINGRWYIARPLPYYSWKSVLTRFYHAWLVIRNKAHVYQYAQDYFKSDDIYIKGKAQ